MESQLEILDNKNTEALQLYKNRRYDDAGKAFWGLAKEYASIGQPGKEAEMKNNASVAWLMVGDPQQALDAAKDTHLVFESLSDHKQAGMAYGNQAAAFDALHKYEEALDFYRKAAENLKTSGEKEYLSIVLKQISQLQLKTGDHLQALASMNTALDSSTDLSGKEKFLQRFLKKIFK
jgi:tetratricopeptide (TPR) repeat protein